MNLGLVDWIFWAVMVWGVFFNGFAGLLGQQ